MRLIFSGRFVIKFVSTVIAVYLAYGIILFWGPWTRPDAYITEDSKITYNLGVVFTGGEGRLTQAFSLLEAGIIDTIVVSSASEKTMSVLCNKYLNGKSLPCILEPDATSTHGNAFYTGELIKKHDKRSILQSPVSSQ